MSSSTPQLECDAILFDLDGVLVDSTKCIGDTWHAWANRNGLDPLVVTRAAHGRRAIEAIRIMAPQLDAAEEAATLAAHESSAIEGVCEVPGARALLNTLPRTGWAVVTSAVRAVASHRLRLAQLPTPRVMVCADDVAHGKPNPEGYRAAATHLGYAAEDCIVVEDAPAGLAAAKSAGMRAIAVTTTHSRNDLSGAALIIPALADLVVQFHHRDNATRLEISARAAARA